MKNLNERGGEYGASDFYHGQGVVVSVAVAAALVVVVVVVVVVVTSSLLLCYCFGHLPKNVQLIVFLAPKLTGQQQQQQ